MVDNKIILQENDFPDISTYFDNGNPTLRAKDSSFEQPMLQTKESLMDIDFYGNFIRNAISQFRHLRVYKGYKNFLMNLGLDHCQYLHNVDSNMATIEMNHCILTIFDVALLICEHYINTYGYVSTFHIVSALREEHTQNRIPLVMMSKTVHQLYHNDDLFFVHPKQVFGQWIDLIVKYQNGLTPEICSKLLYYIKHSMEVDGSYDNDLLQLAECIRNWSYNNYGSYIEPININIPMYLN